MRKITKRVCDLCEGDEFMFPADVLSRKVKGVSDKVIIFYTYREYRDTFTIDSTFYSIGSKSMERVYVLNN